MFASTGAPGKHLMIHHAMQTVWFLAWFFKTKLDNMSGCAAFYHSLAEERIGNGKGRNNIGLLFQNQGMTSNSVSLDSGSVSNTECDGNTPFQGFLLEQVVNSEFSANRASGYSDVFHLFVIGLGGFQTHQCCLVGSHGAHSLVVKS